MRPGHCKELQATCTQPSNFSLALDIKVLTSSSAPFTDYRRKFSLTSTSCSLSAMLTAGCIRQGTQSHPEAQTQAHGATWHWEQGTVDQHTYSHSWSTSEKLLVRGNPCLYRGSLRIAQNTE